MYICRNGDFFWFADSFEHKERIWCFGCFSWYLPSSGGWMFPDNLCRKERTSTQAHKREEINLISSLCLANFWIYQLAWCSHVASCCKSLEINSYKMRLGFNRGFSFLLSPVTYIRVRYWNLLHESSVVLLCLKAALKAYQMFLYPTNKENNQFQQKKFFLNNENAHLLIYGTLIFLVHFCF